MDMFNLLQRSPSGLMLFHQQSQMWDKVHHSEPAALLCFTDTKHVTLRPKVKTKCLRQQAEISLDEFYQGSKRLKQANLSVSQKPIR